MSTKSCSKCNVSFECCNEKEGCWCENVWLDIPTLNHLKQEYSNCLCYNCLKQYSKEEVSEKK